MGGGELNEREEPMSRVERDEQVHAAEAKLRMDAYHEHLEVSRAQEQNGQLAQQQDTSQNLMTGHGTEQVAGMTGVVVNQFMVPPPDVVNEGRFPPGSYVDILA